VNLPADQITLVDAGAEAIDFIMPVMESAFDAAFGEAWRRDQCLGILGMSGVWLKMALVENSCAGFALTRAAGGEAELLLIAVIPKMQGKGIGLQLIDSVIKDAAARGASLLHLEVRDGNEAYHLYRKLGFVPVGRRTSYYRGRFGQSFDALTLTKTL